VGAHKGEDHHLIKKQIKDQAEFLSQVARGVDEHAALAIVGRKPGSLKTWLRDGDFAFRLEEARNQQIKLMGETLAGGKENLDYATFSKEFLNSEVFPHHQSWIDVLEGREPSWLHPAMTFEPGNRRRLLINVPPEHAKSTVLTVGYATYRIAMNPNIRIVIVSQTQTRAKEFLYSIKQRLTEPDWAKMQGVYGPAGGYKATADQWTADRIYLERSSGEKDPTVQAIGMGQQIYGTRADLIILDDVVTTTNAHEWEKQLNWLQKMVITRVGATGTLVIAGTRVSSVDLYKEIRNPDHWSGGKSPFTYLAMPAVLEFKDKREEWLTLWSRSDRPWDGAEEGQEDDAELLVQDEEGYYPKWDGKRLFARRSEVNPATWALVYQQQDVEEDSIFPLPLVNSSINRMRKPGPLKMGAPGHPREGQWVTILGFDPAMSGKAAMVAYAIERHSGQRLVLDVYNMHQPNPQKIRELMEEWVIRYRPIELRVEINAHQKAYALDEDLRIWMTNHGCQMREHFTGKNKWDTSFGVAGMSSLFGTMREGKQQNNNLIELPDVNNEHIKALVNQLITWKPDTKNPTDCVMALWFCEIRAKELILQGMNRTSHMSNRYATRKNQMQQYVVDLDEAAYEQHMIYL
jgi:hypothetical protein